MTPGFINVDHASTRTISSKQQKLIQNALPNDCYYGIIDINVIKIVPAFCIGVHTYCRNDTTNKLQNKICSGDEYERYQHKDHYHSKVSYYKPNNRNKLKSIYVYMNSGAKWKNRIFCAYCTRDTARSCHKKHCYSSDVYFDHTKIDINHCCYHKLRTTPNTLPCRFCAQNEERKR